MAPHNLLSDSDSDDGSPAVRPTASRPKSKSAPPKSAKTEVQAGRSRAARAASDDGMDSDASDEPNDAALQAVMQQLTKQAFPCPRSALVRTPAQPPCATWAPTVSPSAPAEDDHAEEGRQEAAALGGGVRAHRWDSAQRPHQHARERAGRARQAVQGHAQVDRRLAEEDQGGRGQDGQAAQGVRAGGPGAGPQDPKGRALSSCKRTCAVPLRAEPGRPRALCSTCARGRPEPQCLVVEGGSDALCPRSL